jgi:hypothetical protein
MLDHTGIIAGEQHHRLRRIEDVVHEGEDMDTVDTKAEPRIAAPSGIAFGPIVDGDIGEIPSRAAKPSS